jgi:DNA ligase-1
MKITLLFLFLHFFAYAEAPRLFLLKNYTQQSDLRGWVMSEKLDGVRAYWDGKQLVSRNGKVFTAPPSFMEDFPPFAMDAELWSRRGGFEEVVSVINTKEAHEGWDALSMNVFEVPSQRGGLFKRLAVLENYLVLHPTSKIKIVKQRVIKEQEEIKAYLEEVMAKGGEGLVLRDPLTPYYSGRTDDALKYKSFIDADCRVLSIIEGKGKLEGNMGAVTCDYQGKVIKIGSGFSSLQRSSPPQIGTVISFKYYGLTHLGNPKYPVFLRVRSDAKLSLME